MRSLGAYAACRRPATRMFLLMVFAAALGLRASTVLATEAWRDELARHWAPCIFQAVQVGAANPLGRYDYITSMDFDGDTCAGNNWENSDDRKKEEFPLLPYVYYSVIETRSHYYITYSLFHPRDWRWYLAAEAPGALAPLPATHENDVESATFVILKDGGYGKLRLVGTVCHLQNYLFVNDTGMMPKAWACDLSSGELQVSYFEGRPCLFVEAGGHGIGGLRRAMREDAAGEYLIGRKKYRFESGAGMVYRCSDAPGYLPESETATEYQLVSLLSSLWPLRDDVAGDGMFEGVFDYEVAPGCVLRDLPVYLAADSQDPGANPPWARDASGDGLERGEWFFRPARAFLRYMDQWPDRDMSGYGEYLWNPYVTGTDKVTVLSPGGGRDWVVGYPMDVGWETGSAGFPLSPQVRVLVSANAGRTWRPIGAAGLASPARTVWNVTGPGGDSCVVAVRAALQCDDNLEAVGYSSTFRIASPDVFTWWELLRSGPSGPMVYDAPAVYDPDGDKLVLFGGRSRDMRLHSATWLFDFTALSWNLVQAGSAGCPPPRCGHAAVYTEDGRLIIHGGYGPQCLGDTWAFDLGSGMWTRLDTGTGDKRAGSAAVLDPVADRLVVFGGWDGEGARNDVRVLELACEPRTFAHDPSALEPWVCVPPSQGAAEWTTLHGGAVDGPPARVDAAGAYDAARRLFIINGGRGGDLEDEPLSDTWAFSLESCEWTLLDDGGDSAPPARWGHRAVMNDRTGNVVVFGGARASGPFGDVWLFDMEGGGWTEVDSGPEAWRPAPRLTPAMVLRPLGNQIVVACGRGDAGCDNAVWSMGLRSLREPKPQPAKGGGGGLARDVAIWPNPSTGEVSVGLAASAGAHLRIAVYDVRGRLMRLLHDSHLKAGYHEFGWDGRNSDGIEVASGVYYFTLSMDGRSHRRPVVMLR